MTRQCLLWLALAALAGCSVQPVKPWQRAVLASPSMAWEGDAMGAAYQRQLQTSKEAASGGPSLAGGGCGCN